MIFFNWFDRILRKFIPEKVWVDNVYSKVISYLITATIGFIFSGIGYVIYGLYNRIPFTQILINLKNFLFGYSTLQNWLIVLLSIGSFGFIVVFILFRKNIRGIKLEKFKRDVEQKSEAINVNYVAGSGYVQMFFDGEWQSWFNDQQDFRGRISKIQIKQNDIWCEDDRPMFRITNFSVKSRSPSPGQNIGDRIEFTKVDIVNENRTVHNVLEVIEPNQHFEGFENGNISIIYKRKDYEPPQHPR